MEDKHWCQLCQAYHGYEVPGIGWQSILLWGTMMFVVWGFIILGVLYIYYIEGGGL